MQNTKSLVKALKKVSPDIQREIFEIVNSEPITFDSIGLEIATELKNAGITNNPLNELEMQKFISSGT
jgi:hypothetical protein